MEKFVLDPRLESDCIYLGELQLSQVLLMNNALVPWFILVPETDVKEIFLLEQNQQVSLLNEINLLSEFVSESFKVDKLNIGAIGNIVNQLHVHVVGRSTDDFCWPEVVWGKQEKKLYSCAEIEKIRSSLIGKGILSYY